MRALFNAQQGKTWANFRKRLRYSMRRNEPSVARLSEGRSPEFRSHRRMSPWNSNWFRVCDVFPCRAKQKSCSPKRTAHCIISDYARVTLPERRQRVQTFTRFTSPSTIARTVCTLGFHAALVWRLEWLTLLPDMMPLPHTSQICAIWFDLLHRISI